MDQYACSLFRDLANPCYRNDFIPIREIAAGAYMLFAHEAWKILVQVRGNLTSRKAENTFLEIDILAFGGCQTPDRKNSIYLCGVDIDLRFVEGKLVRIPFLRAGQGFLLCDEISDSVQQIGGLFYEIKDMFILDSSKYC